MKVLLISCCLIISLCCPVDKSLASIVSWSESSLPGLIVAYGLYCARYDEFKLLGSNPQNVLIMLGKNINALPGGISTGLAFAHRAFVVQNEIEGHLSGFLRVRDKTLEGSKVPFESILFVTTPIASYENRILVILSSVSPERTTIFSVDKNLKVELLYDSIHKNYFDDKKTTVGSIYNVEVVEPGKFLLQERMEPGGRGFLSPYKNRSFMIDIAKGSFEISLITADK